MRTRANIPGWRKPSALGNTPRPRTVPVPGSNPVATKATSPRGGDAAPFDVQSRLLFRGPRGGKHRAGAVERRLGRVQVSLRNRAGLDRFLESFEVRSRLLDVRLRFGNVGDLAVQIRLERPDV